MPKRKTEVIWIRMEADLDRRLKEVSQATELNRDAIIRWAIVKELPGIEAGSGSLLTSRQDGTLRYAIQTERFVGGSVPEAPC